MKKWAIIAVLVVGLPFIGWQGYPFYLANRLVENSNSHLVLLGTDILVVKNHRRATELATRRLLEKMPTVHADHRYNISGILFTLDPDPALVIPDLLKMLQHHKAGVRWTAANHLRRYAKHPTVIGSLTDLINDPASKTIPNESYGFSLLHETDFDLRPNRHSILCVAVSAIGESERKGADVIPRLKELINDEDPVVRLHACISLWKITERTDAILPVLDALLADEQYKDSTVVGIGKLGVDGKDFAPKLMDLLQLKRSSLVQDTIHSLTELFGDHQSIVEIIKYYNSMPEKWAPRGCES